MELSDNDEEYSDSWSDNGDNDMSVSDDDDDDNEDVDTIENQEEEDAVDTVRGPRRSTRTRRQPARPDMVSLSWFEDEEDQPAFRHQSQRHGERKRRRESDAFGAHPAFGDSDMDIFGENAWKPLRKRDAAEHILFGSPFTQSVTPMPLAPKELAIRPYRKQPRVPLIRLKLSRPRPHTASMSRSESLLPSSEEETSTALDTPRQSFLSEPAPPPAPWSPNEWDVAAQLILAELAKLDKVVQQQRQQ